MKVLEVDRHGFVGNITIMDKFMCGVIKRGDVEVTMVIECFVGLPENPMTLLDDAVDSINSTPPTWNKPNTLRYKETFQKDHVSSISSLCTTDTFGYGTVAHISEKLRRE
jgi:hypothetical protein